MPTTLPKCPLLLRVIRTNFAFAAIAAMALPCPLLRAEPKWKVQYFYDKDDSSLTFADIVCPSAKRCVATGVVQEGKRDKGVVVVTSDGGASWQLEEVKEHPVSVFFLNDTIGWMVTDRGIWQTEEGGHGWKKIKDQKLLDRVYFLNEQHGWAVGAPKLVMETVDGGHKWTPVADAETPPTAADNTVYHWIVFPTPKQGLIVGAWALPRNPDEVPDWMSPDRAKYRHSYPSTTILLQTTDEGKKWSQISRSMEGLVTRFRFGRGSFGLALIEFPNSAEVSTELIKMDLDSGKNSIVYRNPERIVKDFALLPSGEAFLITTERPGKANGLPIPGKLKIMQSTTLNSWLEMSVDYRAVAGRATLAAGDNKNVWVATDTGMILKLQ